MGLRLRTLALASAVICLLAAVPASSSADLAREEALDVTLSDAQLSFYNARYAQAAAQTLELREADPDGLESYELRSSALLFQLKGALGANPDGAHPDKAEELKQCAVCPELMADFARETARGQVLARARLKADPEDDQARFLLAKLDLNYVWLHLGTLGRKTGWNEYWEGRRSIDAVLKRHPDDIRAQVARAWIDYIVDTKMPRGTKWLLGGGSRKRALLVVRKAAAAEGDLFVRAEAAFALLEMEIRERNLTEAVAVARALAREFPDNLEVSAFLATNGTKRAP